MASLISQQIHRRRAQMASMGGSPRLRRRVAPQQPPKAIERAYLRYLLDFLREARNITRAMLIPQLSALAVRTDAQRQDDRPKRAKSIVDNLRRASAGNEVRLGEQIREFGRRTTEYQRSQLQRQIRTAVGVEVPLRDAGIGEKLRDWTTENVSLIKSLPSETFDRIERIVLSGVNDGRRWEEIADDIEERFKVSESRAALIARDQVGKLYGAVNKARQTELGLTHYFWRTERDERVRPAHLDRDGNKYAWKDPPADGHPGQPINCRCTAEPDFSDLLDDLG